MGWMKAFQLGVFMRWAPRTSHAGMRRGESGGMCWLSGETDITADVLAVLGAERNKVEALEGGDQWRLGGVTKEGKLREGRLSASSGPIFHHSFFNWMLGPTKLPRFVYST